MTKYLPHLGILIILALVGEVFAFLPFRFVRTAQAAAVSIGTGTTSTANVPCYTAPSFTPAANDYLLPIYVMSGSLQATGTVTSSIVTETFTAVSTTANFGGNIIQVYVPNQLTTNAARTMTKCNAQDAGTGIIFGVLRISGMTLTGLSSIRQVSSTPQIAANRIPSSSFDNLTLNTNPLISFVGNNAASATGTPATPVGWKQLASSTFLTPATGGVFTSVDSGVATTSVAWAGVSPTAFAILNIELDASTGGGGSTPAVTRKILGRGLTR